METYTKHTQKKKGTKETLHGRSMLMATFFFMFYRYSQEDLAYQGALLSQLEEVNKHFAHLPLSVVEAKRASLLQCIRSLPKEASFQEQYEHLFRRDDGLFDNLTTRFISVHAVVGSDDEIDMDDPSNVSELFAEATQKFISILEDEGVDLENSSGGDDDDEEEEEDIIEEEDDDDDDEADDDDDEEAEVEDEDEEDDEEGDQVEDDTEERDPSSMQDDDLDTDNDTPVKRRFQPDDDDEEDELDELNDDEDDQAHKRRRA
ncbi:hypothetical protein BC940DRAFT_289448, partial [Gongronella butleri]